MNTKEIEEKYGYDCIYTYFDKNGIAIAMKDGKCFHIDKDGKALYDERFDYVDNYNEDGIARVGKDCKEFNINKKGERV